MSLSNRFGFGRRAGSALLADDSASSEDHPHRPELKSPQVRTIHRSARTPLPQDPDQPYPSRFDENAETLSLFDRLRLSVSEHPLVERLLGRWLSVELAPEPPPLPVLAAKNSQLPANPSVVAQQEPQHRTPAPAATEPQLVARPPEPPQPKPAPPPAPATRSTEQAARPSAPPARQAPYRPEPAAKPAQTARRAPQKATPKPQYRPAPPVKPAAKKKLDRGDLTLGALGVVLGLTCALFPWYIFFNQDKFGVREFVFEGNGTVTPPSQIAYQPSLVGQHFQTGEVPKMDLDFFPTATLPVEDEARRAVPTSEQPFPSDLVTFRLVHVANGRAMIQDGDGLWIVQPGSRLPDASQVASIEQRRGEWVLVTTLDKVVPLQP